jgi:transcriptional regulator with XRE-family HTH domain
MRNMLHIMDAKTLGQTLTKKRVDMGFTQEALANIVQVSRRTIINLEAGNAEIGLRRLMKIASVLGLELTLVSASERPTEENLRSIFLEDE